MPHLSRPVASLACAAALFLGSAAPVQASAVPHLSAAADDGGGSIPGMDHGSMPGMDHGSMPGTDHGSMPGTTHATDEAGSREVSRPRTAVLGSFVGVNAAVMLAAAFVRRRTSRRCEQRRAGRAVVAA
jgi:uncharacterized protein involved in copper resistance